MKLIGEAFTNLDLLLQKATELYPFDYRQTPVTASRFLDLDRRRIRLACRHAGGVHAARGRVGSGGAGDLEGNRWVGDE